MIPNRFLAWINLNGSELCASSLAEDANFTVARAHFAATECDACRRGGHHHLRETLHLRHLCRAGASPEHLQDPVEQVDALDPVVENYFLDNLGTPRAEAGGDQAPIDGALGPDANVGAGERGQAWRSAFAKGISCA